MKVTLPMTKSVAACRLAMVDLKTKVKCRQKHMNSFFLLDFFMTVVFCYVRLRKAFYNFVLESPRSTPPPKINK